MARKAHDMGRYRNLENTEHQRTVGGLLKWQMERLRRPNAEKTAGKLVGASFVANDGTLLRGAEKNALTWIGHASWLVQLAKQSMVIDPILGARIAMTIPRHCAPGLTEQTLPTLNALLITHNHRDHMDEPSIRALLRRDPGLLAIVPAGLKGWIQSRGHSNCVELEWWQSVKVGEATVTFVPSQHWSRRSLLDEDETLWGGYVLSDETTSVYHTGDTAYFSGFSLIKEKLGAPVHALLPIGAYEPRWFMRSQHMNPEDSVQAYLDLQATHFHAMHWGTFQLTDEPFDEPPKFVRRLWEEKGLNEGLLHIPAAGETTWI